ncbi:MAG TPA: glycosyltransferase family 87 protein [Bryobacteraceae bacterium]|nr:glycosyltransferase family 87 protein [Bryobacteraceae bacterium]HPU72189.1 glycosyltransferase family 87 protein [Bryobacteraceae bacterium]
MTLPRGVALMASALGLLMMFVFWSGAAGQIANGYNDFLGFYAGARLCRTPELYQAEAVTRLQLAEAGATASALRFTRAPFYALMLSPLGHLPFRSAYFTWMALNLAALAGHYLLAGVVLSMCAIKYHLFLLVPLALVAQRLWRVLAGAGIGAVALTALSFVAGGPQWPAAYLKVLADPAINPSIETMPALAGSVSGLEYGNLILWVFGIAVAAACWFIARRAPDFETAFAASLLGSLLLSCHSYVSDATLLIPALLILAERRAIPLAVAYAALSPVPYFMLLRGSPAADLVRIAMLLVVGVIAVRACSSWRKLPRLSPSGEVDPVRQ